MSLRTGTVAAALALDAVLVVGFAAAGRASHDAEVLAGLARTSWPFLVGLAAGWALTRGWRAPVAPVRTGLGIWGATVAGGMILRVVSGQGTAAPFIIVAALTLLVLLVGWRLLAAGIRARRNQERRSTALRDGSTR